MYLCESLTTNPRWRLVKNTRADPTLGTELYHTLVLFSISKTTQLETHWRRTAVTKISVNHVQANNTILKDNKVGVGGKLQIDNKYIEFVPTKWDKMMGGDRVAVQVEEIDTVGKKKKYTSSIFDTLFAGGLHDRLQIQRTDGTEELFVVPNLDEIMDELNQLIE
jgi:hypothetical protein